MAKRGRPLQESDRVTRVKTAFATFNGVKTKAQAQNLRERNLLVAATHRIYDEYLLLAKIGMEEGGTTGVPLVLGTET